MKYNIENNKEELEQLFPSIKHVFNLDFLNSLESGKTELNDNDFCIKTGYQMRNLEEQFFESHKKYIDIHITIEGQELFAVSDISELTDASEYDASGDGIVYSKDNKISALKSSKPGDVLVFYQQDGHMTAIGDMEDSVRKVIVKVLDENSSN